VKNMLSVGRYLLLKAVMLGLTVMVGCYLIVLIVNMGGELDDVRRAEIRSAVGAAIFLDPSNRGIPATALKELVDETAELEFERLGLDRPFFPWRSLEYLFRALSLDLGIAEQLTSDTGSREVRRILAERLPATLLLFSTSSLLLFFLAIQMALFLSRRYGSLVDKVMVGMAPLSSAPGWFYGIFMILIFAAVLRILPWGGLVRVPPPKESFAYALSLLQHMILPVVSITIGAIFANVYRWRTFFLIYSSEDYVELAKAKGLSTRAIQRQYILRPTLPTIITSLMLILITAWQGQIILETVFNWPGLGRQFLAATNLNDTPVILGTLVIYGYLLAGTLFLLEFIYAVVDPRVRVAGGRR
jgi:peptide/nickel transport system permease protein